MDPLADERLLPYKQNLVVSSIDVRDEIYDFVAKYPSDIVLVNTSNRTLNFNERGYSVTVSTHGTAIHHIGSNQTHVGS